MEPQKRTPERTTGSVRATASSQRCAMRVIKDENRRMMVVYEIEPSELYAGPRALVFESRHASWRLEKYPSEWRRLSSEELLALRPELPVESRGTTELE